MARPRDWDQAAARLGLDYQPWGLARPARLSGSLGGFQVEVALREAPEYDATEYRVSFPPLGLGLSLRRAAPVRRLGRKLRRADAPRVTGNPEFDLAMTVGGNDPERLTTFLDQSRQAALLDLFTQYPGAVVSDDRVRWSSHTVDRAERVEATLHALVGAATMLRR